jgi:hypothetical protein
VSDPHKKQLMKQKQREAARKARQVEATQKHHRKLWEARLEAEDAAAKVREMLDKRPNATAETLEYHYDNEGHRIHDA